MFKNKSTRTHRSRKAFYKKKDFKLYLALTVVLLMISVIFISFFLLETGKTTETLAKQQYKRQQELQRLREEQEALEEQGLTEPEQQPKVHQEDTTPKQPERAQQSPHINLNQDTLDPQENQDTKHKNTNFYTQREEEEEDNNKNEGETENDDNNNDNDNDDNDNEFQQFDKNNKKYGKCKKTFTPGKVISIVGMPRSGSTLLFNIVRLLVEYEDSNTISGYEIPAEEVYFWSQQNISVVIKTHDQYKMYINPLKHGTTSENGLYNAPQGVILSDYALYSKRDLGSAMCSLYRLGWVDEASSKRRCMNMVAMNRTIHRRIKLKYSKNQNGILLEKPTFLDPFSFDEITEGRKSMKSLIKKISYQLGICASDKRIQWVENAVNSLKPVALPSPDSKSAQNPRSLLHSKHMATSNKNANGAENANWNCTPVYQWIQKVKRCNKVYSMENGLPFP